VPSLLHAKRRSDHEGSFWVNYPRVHAGRIGSNARWPGEGQGKEHGTSGSVLVSWDGRFRRAVGLAGRLHGAAITTGSAVETKDCSIGFILFSFAGLRTGPRYHPRRFAYAETALTSGEAHGRVFTGEAEC
jgi:hypothetical protein